MDRYTRMKELGRGSFGCALLCEEKDTGSKVVIKEIDMTKMASGERTAALQEAKVLMSLNHPNIVRCHESFVEKGRLYIVMDWCKEGDLYAKIKKLKGQLLPEKDILQIFSQIAAAMAYVHGRKILHRDIKTQNIFIDEKGVVKLGDFGVAKVLGSTMALASTAVGTPYYLSPEICENRKYNAKSDIWSLGCVLYEMSTTRHAFDAASIGLLVNKILRGRYPPVSPSYSKDLRELIGKMISRSPSSRPAALDIVQMPFLRRCLPSQSICEQEPVADITNNAKPIQRISKAPVIAKPPTKSPIPGRMREGGGGGGEMVKVQGPRISSSKSPSHQFQRQAKQAAAGELIEVRGRAAGPSQLMPHNDPNESSRQRHQKRVERDAARRRAEKMEIERRKSEEAEIRAVAIAQKRAERDLELQRIAKEREREREIQKQLAAAAAKQKDIENAKRAEERKEKEIRLKEFKRCQAEALKNRQKHLLEEERESNGIEIFVSEAPSKRAHQPKMMPGPSSPPVEAIIENVVVTKESKLLQEGAAKRDVQPKGRKAPQEPVVENVVVSHESKRKGGGGGAGGGGGDNIDLMRQREAFFEAREAAMRNKQQVLLELEGGSPKPLEEEEEEGEEKEDAASSMAVDDKAVLGDAEAAAAAVVVVMKEEEEDEDEEDESADPSPVAMITKFVVNGKTLELPNFSENDTTHQRIEALREFLEVQLGLPCFMRAYRVLEALDEEQEDDVVIREMEAILGEGQMGFISLIHQLLVCEESEYGKAL